MTRAQIVAASAVVVGLLLVTKKAKAALQPPLQTRMVEALARMLITETSFKASEAEMAQIVFAALNRARAWGADPADVVYGPRVGSARQGWNGGSTYRTLYDRADQKDVWEPAKSFVRRVLAGDFKNGGYTSFVHPGAARFTFPCNDDLEQVEDGRWSPAFVPGYGTRCIPKWVHGGTVVGRALFT